MAGYAGLAALGLLMPLMLVAGSLPRVGAFLCISFFVQGFVSGPLGAILPSLFPTRVRYSGASIAFSAGGILGGGVSPMIATALAAKGGLAPVSVYYSGAALLSFVALALLGRKSGRHLD